MDADRDRDRETERRGTENWRGRIVIFVLTFRYPALLCVLMKLPNGAVPWEVRFRFS